MGATEFRTTECENSRPGRDEGMEEGRRNSGKEKNLVKRGGTSWTGDENVVSSPLAQLFIIHCAVERCGAGKTPPSN